MIKIVSIEGKSINLETGEESSFSMTVTFGKISKKIEVPENVVTRILELYTGCETTKKFEDESYDSESNDGDSSDIYEDATDTYVNPKTGITSI